MNEEMNEEILNEISNANPIDSYILFMGFCPSADFDNRLDTEWKKKDICKFDYLDSKHQQERFNTICKGDLVILKKREKIGKTMKLYGHGRVSSVEYDKNNIRYLAMYWSKQEQVIEVPLMACNSTVNIKNITTVKAVMPKEFYQWLDVTPIPIDL